MLTVDQAPLFRFICRRGAGDDAEDVLQELWLKVGRLPDTASIADPRAYLFRMADNLIHDRARAARRRANRERTWSQISYDCGGRDETPSPDRAIAARQRLRRVETALASLGGRSQTIFRRFRIEGISQAEIAREEGISISAVQKHLGRAYRLIAMLAREEEAEQAGAERYTS